MPHLGVRITKAWRHDGEPNRIHYTIERVGDAPVRHLYVDAGQSLYDVLDAHLRAQGYTGPRRSTSAA